MALTFMCVLSSTYCYLCLVQALLQLFLKAEGDGSGCGSPGVVTWPHALSLNLLLEHSPTRVATCSLPHSVTQSVTDSLDHPLPRELQVGFWFNHSLTHSPTTSPTLTHWPTHPCTHPPTHSFTTHPPTRPPTPLPYPTTTLTHPVTHCPVVTIDCCFTRSGTAPCSGGTSRPRMMRGLLAAAVAMRMWTRQMSCRYQKKYGARWAEADNAHSSLC